MARQSLLLLSSVVASFLAALMLLARLAGTSLAAAPPDAPDAPFPVITSVITNGAFISVKGKASPSLFLSPTRVEVYAVILNANGFTDGYFYAGTTLSDINGNWTAVVQSYFGSCFMAFQTHSSFATLTSTSSEFGPTNCRTFLPLVVR